MLALLASGCSPSPDTPTTLTTRTDTTGPFPAYYRVPPTGSQDTILAPRGAWPTRPAEVCKDDRGSTWIWGSPFSQVRVWVPYLGGQVVNVGTDYRLAVINAAGDTVRMLVRDVALAPVTDEDWRAGTSASRAGHDTLRLSGCTGEQVRYEFKPAITALATDEDGRLWVRRAAVDGTFWEAWRGDTLLGRVPASPQWGDSPPSFLGDRVAVLQEGPEGGYQVGVYRIVEQGSRRE